MALHWSVEDVADMEAVCFWTAGPEDVSFNRGIKEGDRLVHPITQTLTFATMPVGINKITKANAGDFYARVSAWERLNGPSCYIDSKDYYITREDVEKHIGLSTNASPKTSKQFWADLGTMWERQLNGR